MFKFKKMFSEPIDIEKLHEENKPKVNFSPYMTCEKKEDRIHYKICINRRNKSQCKGCFLGLRTCEDLEKQEKLLKAQGLI